MDNEIYYSFKDYTFNCKITKILLVSRQLYQNIREINYTQTHVLIYTITTGIYHSLYLGVNSDLALSFVTTNPCYNMSLFTQFPTYIRLNRTILIAFYWL